MKIAVAIAVGEVFEIHGADARRDTLRREPDGTGHNGPLRVTHLTCTHAQKMKPYTFDTEPAWFTSRGLVAEGGEAAMVAWRAR